jgi:hypothetical protein
LFFFYPRTERELERRETETREREIEIERLERWERERERERPSIRETKREERPWPVDPGGAAPVARTETRRGSAISVEPRPISGRSWRTRATREPNQTDPRETVRPEPSGGPILHVRQLDADFRRA